MAETRYLLDRTKADPLTDNAYDWGSASYRWREGFAHSLDLSGGIRGPVLDVTHRDFGASPSASASTNRLAFVAALAAASGGGSVRVPGIGTYLIDLDGAGGKAIHINNSNITLLIEGGATIKLADGSRSNTSGENIIRIGDGSTALSGIRVVGPGIIDGNVANNPSTASIGSGADVRVTGPITDLILQTLAINDSYGDAIRIDGQSAASRASQITIDGIHADGCGEGIVWSYADRVVCVNNVITNVTLQDGVEAIGSDHFVIANNYIEGHSSNSAIDLFTPADADDTYGLVASNVIVTAGAGININSGGGSDLHDVTVIGNILDLSGTSTAIAIDVGTTVLSQRVLIGANNIYGAKDGVTVGAAADDITIADNLIRGSNEMGVRVLDGATKTDIIDNAIFDVVQFGVQVSQANDVRIAGNRLQGCAEGIRLGGTAGNLVERVSVLDNWILDNTSRGMALQYTDEIQIVGNILHNNTAGILFFNTNTNLTFRHNHGFITENNGTATVTSGNTTIVVGHGLDRTPDLQDISVTPTNNLGNASLFWISTPTSTQFTINVDADPGATTATFVWTAAIV